MKAFVFLLCWNNPVSLTVNRWLSRLHPIQGSNWKMVVIKKEKIWSPHSHSIFLVHEILVSLMILYVCNTFICQIDKYACWSIKGKRVKNLSVSLSWETSLIRSELKYSYVKTSILKITSRLTLKFITKLPNAKLMVRLKLWNCRRGKENWTNNQEIFHVLLFLYLVVATSEFLPFSDLVPKLRDEDEVKCEVNCVKN